MQQSTFALLETIGALMFKLKQAFFGERSITKVAGLFASRTDADDAVVALLGASSLATSQVRLLGPKDGEAARDGALDRAVEPEQRGIWRTIIRAHATMAVLGLLAGALAYGLLLRSGSPALQDLSGLGWVVFGGFGMMFGLIFGGLLALRPDHGRVIHLVRRALQSGEWAVVAHPQDANQTHQAVASLSSGSLRVVRSF